MQINMPRLLVVSSLDQELRGKTVGLEIVFQEAMHQWDKANFETLAAAAKAQNVRFPRVLDHAMLFFVGEAFAPLSPSRCPTRVNTASGNTAPGGFSRCSKMRGVPTCTASSRATTPSPN